MSTRIGRMCRDMDEFIMVSPVSKKADMFLSILANNVIVEGEAVKNTPPDFIQKTIAKNGGIVFVKSVNEWAEYVPCYKNDRFGFPKKIKMVGDDGKLSSPLNVGDDIVIIPANATFTPFFDEIKKYCEVINEIDTNIFQNLDNLREMTVTHVFDDDLDMEIKMLDRKRRNGETHGIIHEKKDGYETKIESFAPNCKNYLLDYCEARDFFEKALYERVGIVKLDKKNETRITGEVEQIEKQANTIIDLIIGTINKYADYYNIDISARRNNGDGGAVDD